MDDAILLLLPVGYWARSGLHWTDGGGCEGNPTDRSLALPQTIRFPACAWMNEWMDGKFSSTELRAYYNPTNRPAASSGQTAWQIFCRLFCSIVVVIGLVLHHVQYYSVSVMDWSKTEPVSKHRMWCTRILQVTRPTIHFLTTSDQWDTDSWKCSYCAFYWKMMEEGLVSDSSWIN